jgi:hypothetical protein
MSLFNDITIKQTVLFIFWTALLSNVDAFSAQTLFPFQRFTFAPNNVCTNPNSFYSTKTANGTLQHLDFTMRNVPGEGDCIFQAVALATSTSLGMGGNNAFLRVVKDEAREVVAQILSAEGTLHIEGKRIVRTFDLLRSAAKKEQLDNEQYLQMLRNGTLHGGGTELTVLSNVLRRPISVYELVWDEDKLGGHIPENCEVKCVGTFGDIFIDPLLDIPNHVILSGIREGAYSWHIHILIVDAGGGDKHACSLLPKIFC